MRALIVDDERLARQEMRSLLGSHPHVTVVGEAASLAEARDILADGRIDVIFLDVQLAGESGFELMASAGHCDVIFVTAFDNHALRAFDCAASDYLLKPVDAERLERALARISRGNRSAAQTGRLAADDWVFAPVGAEHGFIKIDRIRCIVAEGDYSRLWLEAGKSSLILRSLREWERCLPAPQYVRVHRSAIANLDYVRSVRGTLRSGYMAQIDSVPNPIPISRRQARRLRSRLN